jgi:predicted RNA binding protein YcfA (HicA-like mRNA interferase family)
VLRDSRDILRRLTADGWVVVRIRGSHHQLRDTVTGRMVTLPHPRKDMPTGTVRSIYRQAGWAYD